MKDVKIIIIGPHTWNMSSTDTNEVSRTLKNPILISNLMP